MDPNSVYFGPKIPIVGQLCCQLMYHLGTWSLRVSYRNFKEYSFIRERAAGRSGQLRRWFRNLLRASVHNKPACRETKTKPDAKGLVLFASMAQAGVPPDLICYNAAISCCAKAHRYNSSTGFTIRLEGIQVSRNPKP